jgi:hypothetical protein
MPTPSKPRSTPHAEAPATSVAEDERVVALFRNRAELKQLHGELLEELERLKARVSRHEATSLRVRAMLDSLEARAGGGDEGAVRVLREQLRVLGRTACAMLADVLARATAERESNERGAWLAECNRRRFAERLEAQGALRVEEARFYDARERLEEVRRERQRYLAPWHFMRRREIDRRVDAASGAVAACEASLAAARALVERLDSVPPPPFPGLSLAARRELNLIAIASAEELARRLASPSLVRLATAALAGQAETGGYGGGGEHAALAAEVGRGFARLRDGLPLSGCAPARVRSLQACVRYGGGDDSVPVPESVGSPRAGRDAAGGEVSLPNVLLEDCWSLSSLLLR